jgi:hypothetical protein
MVMEPAAGTDHASGGPLDPPLLDHASSARTTIITSA